LARLIREPSRLVNATLPRLSSGLPVAGMYRICVTGPRPRRQDLDIKTLISDLDIKTLISDFGIKTSA
jgi:hypothetical protein